MKQLEYATKGQIVMRAILFEVKMAFSLDP